MKLFYQPVSPFVVGQKFGENRACIRIDGTDVITCDGYNPPPGYKSVYGKEGHTGIDVRAYLKQPVYCARKGKVVSIDTNVRSGLDVRIESEVDGVNYRHVYEHLDAYLPKVGQELETGELIGWAGTTGRSSGVHLHFGVYQKFGTKWMPIDPLPLMYEYFANDYLYLVSKVRWLLSIAKS